MQRDYIRLFKDLGDKRCCEVCPLTSRLRFQTSKGKSPGPSQSFYREQIQLVVGPNVWCRQDFVFGGLCRTKDA